MEKKTSVSRRIALRIAIFGFAASFAALLFFVVLQRKSVESQAISEAFVLAEAVAVTYQLVDRPDEMDRASQFLLRIARVPNVAFVNVMGENGRVLYSTDTARIGSQFGLRDGVSEEGDLHLVTHVVSTKTSTVAAVTVAMDMKSVFAEKNWDYLELAIGILIVFIFLTLLAALVVERLVASRLMRLATTMEDVERGSFLARAKVDVMDEVGQVASIFNQLLSALTKMQVKEIEREQDLREVQQKLSTRTKLAEMAEELKDSNTRLERRVKAQELLMEAAHHLGGILDKTTLINRLVSLVRDKMGWPDFAIFLTEQPEGQDTRLRLCAASGLPDINIIRQMTFRLGEGITGLVAQTGSPIMVNDMSLDNRIKVMAYFEKRDEAPDFLRSGSMLSVPMLYQGKVVGVMDFFYPKRNAFDDGDIELLHALGAQVAVALVNADLYEKTLELATSDPLTGLMNRRAMEKQIEGEIARSRRFSTPFALVMIDVDYFKTFNDRMGHVLGDMALKQIASVLQRSVRRVDTVARFGGEEFCVILPQTNRQAAQDVAEKLCAFVVELDTRGASKQPLGHMSISAGIALYPDDVPSSLDKGIGTELVSLADKALYQAKRQGRNRVVVHAKS